MAPQGDSQTGGARWAGPRHTARQRGVQSNSDMVGCTPSRGQGASVTLSTKAIHVYGHQRVQLTAETRVREAAAWPAHGQRALSTATQKGDHAR